MNYQIVYSERKTVSICIKDDGVIVRVPCGVSRNRIDFLVNKHIGWIDEMLKLYQKKREFEEGLSEEQVRALKLEAEDYFASELDKHSKIMSLKFSRMKITSAKKRFGSCNSNGTICFSYRLMLYPIPAREYVVVHELAHLKYMNHSSAFHKLIEDYMPDYKTRNRLLK